MRARHRSKEESFSSTNLQVTFPLFFSPVKWEFAGYINRGKACDVRGKVIEDACEVVGSCGGSWPFWLSSQYPHKNHEMCSDIIQSMERDEKQQVTAHTYKSNPR